MKLLYNKPQVTIVSFMIEEGFIGSVILGATTLQSESKSESTGIVFTEYTDPIGEYTIGTWQGLQEELLK